MIEREIAYSVQNRKFTGYFAHEETSGGKRPGILVCHQGPGLNEHTREQTRRLAAEGYVAFALDMYGEVPQGLEHAMQLLRGLMADPAETRRRAGAGLAVLKGLAGVDPDRLAAIGFCFGGWLVLDMVREHAELACVVAFHPGLTNQPEHDDRPVHGKVLVCAGADDPYVTAEARQKFIVLMTTAAADWQLHVYGGVGHSFTDTSVDAMNYPGFRYDARANQRSWAAMSNLFGETWGTPHL